MKVIQYFKENEDVSLKQKIIDLEASFWPKDNDYPSSLDTFVTSFVLVENDKAISHVAIRKTILQHQQDQYQVYGLSEVITHLDYRNNGLATQLIKKSIQYIINQHADLSIFTCKQKNTSLYTSCGYQIMPTTCFIGGTKENPINSHRLNLVTMMILLTPKAKHNMQTFENTDLVFELGENKLW